MPSVYWCCIITYEWWLLEEDEVASYTMAQVMVIWFFLDLLLSPWQELLSAIRWRVLVYSDALLQYSQDNKNTI